MPANSRAGPNGAMSPYPSEVYVTSEKLRTSTGIYACGVGVTALREFIQNHADGR